MKLGLIAGNRKYPLIFAYEAKKRGVELIVVGFYGETALKIRSYADKLYWVRVGELEKLMQIFKREGVSEAVMAGQITPSRLFKKITADSLTQRILNSIEVINAQSIFSRIADELESAGIILKDARLFMDEYIAERGIISGGDIDGREKKDLELGLKIAKEIAGLGIGQTVVVKSGVVVAVEAMEGTDSTVRRGGRIGKGNVVVVKVARPDQDMRFDVPVAGPRTVQVLADAGGGILGLEAGKVIILEKEKVMRLCKKKGVRLIGL